MMHPDGTHLIGNPCVCQTCCQARDDARAVSFRDGQERMRAELVEAREECDGFRIIARKLHATMKQAWDADAFAEWFTDTDNAGVDIPFLIGLLPAIDGPDETEAEERG